MVQDDPASACDRDRILLDRLFRPQPRTDMAHDHIVGRDDQWLPGQGDSPARRGLAGQGHATPSDDQRTLQPDDAAGVEHNGPGPFGLDRGAQAAGTGIARMCDPQHTPAAPADRIAPGAFGARKGPHLCRYILGKGLPCGDDRKQQSRYGDDRDPGR